MSRVTSDSSRSRPYTVTFSKNESFVEIGPMTSSSWSSPPSQKMIAHHQHSWFAPPRQRNRECPCHLREKVEKSTQNNKFVAKNLMCPFRHEAHYEVSSKAVYQSHQSQSKTTQKSPSTDFPHQNMHPWSFAPHACHQCLLPTPSPWSFSSTQVQGASLPWVLCAPESFALFTPVELPLHPESFALSPRELRSHP